MFHVSSFQQKRQIRGYIQVFELGTAQTVDDGVQKAIQIREAHESVVDLNGDFLRFRKLRDSNHQQHQPRNSRRPKAENKHQDNQSDQEHGSSQLGPVADRLLLQPVGDPDSTVDQDDRWDENRREKHKLSEGNRGGGLWKLSWRVVRLVAVAALEAGQHGRDGQRHKHNPDQNRDENVSLPDLEGVPNAGMNHAEVTIDGNDSQEGDARFSVQEEHKQDRSAYGVVVTPSLSTLEVIRPDRQTDQQQDIRQDEIEEKNVVAFRFPEFEFKNEEVDHGEVQRKCQDKLHYHHREIERVQILTSSCTVVTRVVCH